MINFIPKSFFLSILLILFPIQSSITIKQNTQNPSDKTQLLNHAPNVSKNLKISPDYGKIPLYFIPNRGRVDEKVLFYSKASKYTIWITNDGLVFDSTKRTKKNEKLNSVIPNPYEINNSEDFTYERDVSRLVFLNSNKNIEVIPVNRTEHKVNYFIGNDKSKWLTNIPTSQAVLYKELYKNIDLKIYGIEKQIEYDFIVKPGGEASKIQFGYKNVKKTKIDKEGNLVIETTFGELKHAKPLCYQVIEGKRIEIKAEFKKTRKNTYGFKVHKFNTDYELIIDPLIYSTYLGGGRYDYGYAITVDGSGNTYVTGATISSDFPTTSGAYDTTSNGYWDVFITKINSTGTNLLYSTFLGGSDYDYGYAIAVDGSGNAYVTGYASSDNFPTTSSAYDTTHNGFNDVFITKINSTGTNLLYSTFLGGSVFEEGRGIAVDGSGNAYVAGETNSSDFPTTSGAYNTIHNGSHDVFLTKINSAGSALLYSTYIGGVSEDLGRALAVDGSGNAYVTGYTCSNDFPTTSSAYDTTRNGYDDVFITKLNSTGSSLLYSTFLGGTENDYGYAITVDGSENACVTGYTASSDFPSTSSANDTSYGGNGDAFITKLNSTGSSLLYSTFLGGSYDEIGYGLAVDESGNSYVTGRTFSDDFPTTSDAYDTSLNSSLDAFITKINATGGSLLYSTFFGGSSSDEGKGIAIDGSGNIYVIGYTQSTDFPTTSNAYDTSFNEGTWDVFISKLGIISIKDDFLGTWTGQGVYYRNSNTGQWVKLGSPATMITAGDIDNDGTDDLIGIWPAQGGVWVKYSSSGSWSRLSSTADWIGAGDMDGDGRDDLLGTWMGQGVYYRNSATSQWVKMATPASQITAGDLDNDGTDDLIGIWPSQGGVWVKYSSSGSWAKLSSTADWISAGDMNGDGRCDLVGTWTGQGVYYRNSQSGSWVKLATPATMTAAGDLDGDSTDDLFGIWPAQGDVWVKYSSDGTWEKLSSTADWIAAGKMRNAGSSGSGVITLSAPIGGIADGPYTFEKHEDLSSEGPGGWDFVFQTQKNLFPIEKELKTMKTPGPGDPAFRCVEQKNLVPQKKPTRERGKKKER